MILKYDIKVEIETIDNSLKRITNQIYKLLPAREEGLDWIKPLTTIIEELAGMDRLIALFDNELFLLLCKLEGLFTLEDKDSFYIYRKTIFECLEIISEEREKCQDLKI
mgnify:CR=1 FL=1